MTAQEVAVTGPQGLTVSAVAVERLFGRYTYRLPFPEGWDEGDRRVVIFYGDNGVGKTTILKSLFYLLSSATTRGHKTELLKVPFSRFTVELADGVRVEAVRDDAVVGPYRFTVSAGGAALVDTTFVVTDGAVKRRENPQIREITPILESVLPFHVYYLGDDRELRSDLELAPSPERERQRARFREMAMMRGELDPGDPETPLAHLLDRASQWLRRQSLQASARGNRDTNTVYTDVLRRIATPYSTDDPSRLTAEETRELLVWLADLNRQYSDFSLLPELDDESISQALATAAGTPRVEPFLEVLVPFLDGLRTRIDALQALYRSMNSFVRALNSFYEDKYVRLTLDAGVQIFANNGSDELRPDALSSGERQLLLLFVNTLFASEKRAIFIVDEPELSLNVKWQRRLVDELLQTTAATPTQFLMATHSFEIFSGARDRVVNVTPFADTRETIETDSSAIAPF